MRALGTFAVGILVLTVFAMLAALIGRAYDWSPFALVMIGGLAGLLFGAGLTTALIADWTDGDTAYLDGWRDGSDDALAQTEARRAQARWDR